MRLSHKPIHLCRTVTLCLWFGLLCREQFCWMNCMQWSCLAVWCGELRKLCKTKVNNLVCRRLWQHVTESLRDGDIDKATEHKRALEERQRNEERLRAETETPWCTKYFIKEVSPKVVSWQRQSYSGNSCTWGCVLSEQSIWPCILSFTFMGCILVW